MKMKIVKIKGKTCDQVLIYRDRFDDGEPCVSILAWHKDTKDEDSDWLQKEDIEFPNEMLADLFVFDYSEVSATRFANSFNP